MLFLVSFICFMKFFIAEDPAKLMVILKDAAKVVHFLVEGIYLLGPNHVNGKPHWIQEGDLTAIWYYQAHWMIGPTKDLGKPIGAIYSPDDLGGPHRATSWNYAKDDKWIEANDLINVTPGIFDNVLYVSLFHIPT